MMYISTRERWFDSVTVSGVQVEDDVPECRTVTESHCDEAGGDCVSLPREICTLERRTVVKTTPLTGCDKAGFSTPEAQYTSKESLSDAIKNKIECLGHWTFPCMKANYSYAINNQRRARNYPLGL